MRKTIAVAVLLVLGAAAQSAAQQSTLHDARVGEWAIYVTAGGNMHERHSVVARRPMVVVVRIDQIINGKVINSRTENFNIEHPAFMSGQFAGEDVANVGGRTYSCFVILQGNRRLLFSHEVPVTGLVVEFRGGAPLREVVDFGY